MIALDTMPDMTELMDRQKLVGWIVRDAIIGQDITYTEAARRWPIALPTLNRLMRTGDVGLRFYRSAEINLGLPRGLLDAVADGNATAIRSMPVSQGFDEDLRGYVLRELGEEPPRRTRRKA